MKRVTRHFVFTLTAVCFGISCATDSTDDKTGNGEGVNNGKPQSYTVAGRVEKGPFVSGSTVSMQVLDADMQALGTVYTTTIEDNAGNFSFGAKTFDAPYAELSANGYFFNEVSGRLSAGTLNLTALVDLSDTSTINVNILTHLKSRRVLNLVATGLGFGDANAQAQQELLNAFGLGRYAEKDVALFSITQGNDEAAALIAISSLLLEDRSEAELTEYLAGLCREFGANGEFSAQTRAQIKRDRESLAKRLSAVKENVINRYRDLGIAVEVKDLAMFFDWDDDGIAGNETLQDGELVVLETDNITVPSHGGTYSVMVTSPVPVYLIPPLTTEYEDVEIEIGGFTELYAEGTHTSMPVESTIVGNQLTISVAPARSRIEKSTSINIYDCIGHLLGSITLVQQGNPASPLPKLGVNGENFLNDNILCHLSGALGKYSVIEQLYHYNSQGNTAENVTPESSNISKMWGDFYTFNRNLLYLKSVDAGRANVYQELFDVLMAMQYYCMVVAWGDVPYFSDYSMYDNYEQHAVRVSSDVILDDLVCRLRNVMPRLDEKRNEPLKSVQDCFFVSRDVSRILLADIYMYRSDWASAGTLLKEVIDGGFYALDNSNYSNKETVSEIFSSKTGNEIIFALANDAGTRNIVIQTGAVALVQTYADVVLSYAECLYKQGLPKDAESVLASVLAAKNIVVEYTDVMQGIAEIRKQLLLYTIGNFAFMKRAGLATREYGVEEYRLLLPIPLEEMALNPQINQNTGW